MTKKDVSSVKPAQNSVSEGTTELQSRPGGSIALRFGLFTAVILIALDLVFLFIVQPGRTTEGEAASSGFSNTLGWTSLAVLVFMVLASVWTRYSWSFNTGNKFNLTSALSTGIPASLLAGLVYGLFRFILFKTVSADIADADMESIRLLLDEQGIVGEDADQNMLWNRRFKYGLLSVGAVMFLYSFIGFMVSVIGGMVLWKRKG